MSKKVLAVVVKRPKIGTDGRTDVVLRDKDAVITPMGYILQARNSGSYRAHDLEDADLGNSATRSQAMHLIQRNFEGRSAKRVLGHTDPAPAPATVPAVVAAPVETPVETPAVRRLTKGEAMADLGISRGALNKRIGRGTVKTETVDGETLIVLS